MLNKNNSNQMDDNLLYRYLGYAAIPLRITLGWMFFSAAWRRVVLSAGKLEPNSPLWVGHKFSTFLPHASYFLGVGGLIHLLLLHPGALAVFLDVFTVIEFLVGMSLIFGLFSRLGGLGAVALAFGILFGSGWLGSTCLDEWQVGSVEMVVGLLILFVGSSWSFDDLVRNAWPKTADSFGYRLIGNGPLWGSGFKTWVAVFAIFGTVVTLGTNQMFQGGVWGKLHNFGKTLVVSVSNAKIVNKNIQFTAYRTGGSPAAYANIIEAKLVNSSGATVYKWNTKDITSLPKSDIHNIYVNKVIINKYSMVMELGAKAVISMPMSKIPKSLTHGNYKLELLNISGAVFSTNFTYSG
ncbi:MAG: TQO small subunit DoxD [Candidatus Acididesulfobacter diazotrophicus]|jgi:thiosulfate dehydrogenase [quinone] large subunit|uniref:TQO small subunit DoxD n=1 Tax=Candidatus Acididesulfobacter diazotrophicus TaxID=2597226 RepID=A0A519BM27_9DELT|nr:MAG: TQO small subunit DoxD [Candidatus Acididesulfobacter diazotrophicus]